MKFNLTVCFLMVAAISFSQKREFQKIEKALKSNDFTGANQVFESIDIAEVSDSYLGTYKFVQGVLKLGDSEEANVNLDEVLNAKALIEEGVEKGYSSDYVLVAMTSLSNRFYAIANESLASKDYQKSATALEQVFLLDTKNMDCAFDIANLYYAAGDLVNAAKFYDILVANKYDGLRTKYLAVRSTTGATVEFPNEKQRLEEIKLGLASNPSDVQTESVVGDIALKYVYIKQKIEGKNVAKQLFTELKTVYPNDDSLELITPEIYLQLGMMDEYATTSAAIKEGLTDPRVFDKLAEAAQSNSNWDAVIENYSKSISLDDQNFPALVNVSNALIQKGNLEKTTAKEQKELHFKAITFLEKAVLMKPQDENVIGTLSQLYNAYQMIDKLNALKAKQ